MIHLSVAILAQAYLAAEGLPKHSTLRSNGSQASCGRSEPSTCSGCKQRTTVAEFSPDPTPRHGGVPANSQQIGTYVQSLLGASTNGNRTRAMQSFGMQYIKDHFRTNLVPTLLPPGGGARYTSIMSLRRTTAWSSTAGDQTGPRQ